MPAPHRPAYDSDEFRRRYHSDETLRNLAEWLGVTPAAVYRAACRRGYQGKLIVRSNGGCND